MYRGLTKLFKYFNYQVNEVVTNIVLKEKYNKLYFLTIKDFSMMNNLFMSCILNYEKVIKINLQFH